MTDNKIIKALKEILELMLCEGDLQRSATISKALDLINRQKAENERLEEENKILSRNADTAFQDGLNEAQDLYAEQIKSEIKADAYKEFADKVHTEIEEALKSNYKAKGERLEKYNVGDSTDFISYCEGKISALRGIDDFCDNLLKEMVK